MTNYEKIMSEMTVEKLAMGMADYYEDCVNCPVDYCMCDYNRHCVDNIKDWLNREAEK